MTEYRTTDTTELARHGREALATTQGGTLHVHGLGPDHDDPGSHEDVSGQAHGDSGAELDVMFYDDSGRPTFLCPPASSVADAAARRRSAVLCVPAPRPGEPNSSLVLAGHLAVVGTEEIHGEDVVVVGLLIHSVILESDDPTLPTVVHHPIPLAQWTSAVPDTMGRTAQRIMRHTNTSHAAQLREFVAELRGIRASQVIAADLVDLDDTGVDIRWLDDRGAHTAHVRFPQRAECPNQLANLLRETLTGHHD